MNRLRKIRSATRRFGIDIRRFPDDDYAHRRARLLSHFGVDLVLDVGANTGQYGTELREYGYGGRIASFEPVPAAYQSLSAECARDPLWDCYPWALGERAGTVAVNVAANSAMSSSILPMLDSHKQAAPGATYVGQVDAPLRRLDDIWAEVVKGARRVFLKLDVQGYEHQVLLGAEEHLADCAGMQLELSLVPLYEGGPTYLESLSLMSEHGFELNSFEPGFSDPTSWRLLQMDGVFFRPLSSLPTAAPS